MLNLDEFVFWQDKDLSELDDRLLLLLFFQEFNLDNLCKAGLLLQHFYNGKKLYPFYSAMDGCKYCYPFEVEYMKLAFKFYHDEMNAFKTLLSDVDLTQETDINEEEILGFINSRKQFEQKLELEYTAKMFGSEILDKLDKVSLNNIEFNENYTRNGALGKVKIGVRKDKKQVAVKINPVWRKSDVNVLKSFLENRNSTPQHKNLLQVYEIGLDVRKRSGRRYEYAYFYSMEKADNLCGTGSYCSKTLANILKGESKLSPPEVVYLLKELGKGLKALHDSGRVHGKIRPENILWVESIPKLSELTCTDNLANLLTFKDTILPSEQKSTLFVKPSIDNDIYALVISAYRAITGNSEKSFPEMPFKILRTTEGMALNKVFLKACAKSRQDRYSSVDKFLKDLERIDTSDASSFLNKKYPAPKVEKSDIFVSRLGEKIMSKLDNVKLKDYKIVKNFRGAGGFGDVRIYEHRICHFRAIKRVNLNNPRAKQEAESVLLYKEKSPKHPNLIKIFEAGCDTEIIDGVEEYFFFYTMEAADNLFDLCHPEYKYYHPVSLYSLKYKKEKYGLDTMPDDYIFFSWNILLKHVIEGLKALHDSGLVHRDIKPDNLILVGGVLKISDVGLVTTIDSIDSLAGTEGYFPPEYFEQSFVNIQRLQKDAIKNDLFAAGISIFNAFTNGSIYINHLIAAGISTFDIFTNELICIEDIERFADSVCEYLRKQKAEEGSSYYSDTELHMRLIKKICAKNPEKRFNSASEVLSEFPEDFVDSFEVPDEFDEWYCRAQARKQDASYFDYYSYIFALGEQH